MTSASSGREALALLERGTEFNLLLTDVMMPDVDGPALLHRVREDPILHEMPVVMMSSNEHADVVLNCLRLGAEDYLLKPVTKKAVKHMWAHVWRRKQRNQMVPRFENGAEVVDEDEFDERMAAGDLAVTRNDVDGVVTVPDPDEFSSDGGSDSDSDERLRAGVDGETEAEARATGLRHEREFVANFRSGRETRAAREPMEMVREGFAEGPRSASGGGHAAPLFPVDRTTRRSPSSPTQSDASDEKRKDGNGDGLEPPLDPAEAAMLADPLLVRDPANPEALRRLAPLAPIEGLAEGKTTIRAWLDDARRAGRGVDRGDALHVLGGAAQLLARAHESGTLLGAMRASALTVTPQGDVGLAPPRPATPPERDSRAPSGVSGRRGRQSARGDAAGRAGNAEDEDEEMDERDERDERKMRVDAAASSAFFASAAPAPPPDSEATRERDSRPLVERVRERDSSQNPCNERLYVSPEERGAGGSTTTGGTRAGAGAPAECFALGVLMVEFCWPEVAAGARGDVGALLAAALRPDGAGAAALAADPEESALAKQLLQPVPGNRPSAAQSAALLARIAESEARRRDAGGAAEDPAETGWRTSRERGVAAEKRRAELVALAGFLRANREARAREAREHRVRSALLAHALRQLGGVGHPRDGGFDAKAPLVPHASRDPLVVPGANATLTNVSAVSNALTHTRQRLSSGGSFSHTRRGVSFDAGLARQTSAPAAHVPFSPGDAPPGEKPSKRRRAPEPPGAPAPERGSPDRAPEKERLAAEEKAAAAAAAAAEGREPSPSSSPPPPRAGAGPGLRRGSFEVRRSADGRPKARVSRPPSRQTSFNEGSGLVSRPSLDRIRQLQASEAAAPGRGLGGLSARSFSAGDLTVLDAGDAALAAAAAGHRPASELDDAAFEALEETFFESCARAVAPVARAYAHATHASQAPPQRLSAGGGGAGSAAVEAEARPGGHTPLELSSSPRRSAAESAASAAGAALSEAFASFGGELAQCVRKTRLKIVADVSHGDVHSFGEMICSVGWDRDGEFVATAGINKRLRVYETRAMTDLGAAVQCPVTEMRVGSKLSSLQWNPYVKRMLASADYDGAIRLWDVDAGAAVGDLDEHEKRVWSLDFSTLDPTRLASGSDDGTVRVWSTNSRASTATIRCRANVCSVQFSPVNANVVAFASAEHKTHVYDLRRTARPLVVLSGHKRAVSYVRWLGAHQLVTASTDNTLKLWDVTKGFESRGSVDPCVRTFAGHVNRRNFVGLDVAHGSGRIACGSEDNTVRLFSKSVPSPVATQSLAVTAAFGDGYGTGTGASGGHGGGHGAAADAKPGLFVSALAWSPSGDRILAANSCGAVKVLQLTHDDDGF